VRQYYEDLLIDALLDRGFTLEEAQRLIVLQERVHRERAAGERQAGRWQRESGPQGHHDHN
jgi:hypothetical protein